jgi:predicted RND superfamily exporter protein
LKALLNSFNQFFEAAPELLLKRRFLVLILFFLVSAVLIFGMVTRFAMDMSLESWFQDDDPTRVSLDHFRQEFGSDDGVYIVYEAEDGDVFSAQSMATLRAFHEKLETIRLGLDDTQTDTQELPEFKLLKRIEQIDSLLNARYQIAQGDTLISKKLLAQDYPVTAEERELKREMALDQRHFRLTFFSEDYRYGGIRLKTDFGVVPKQSQVSEQNQEDLLAEDDFAMSDEIQVDQNLVHKQVEFEEMRMDEYLDFMTELRLLAAMPDFAPFKFYFTGQAAMMEFAMNNMKQASGLMGLMLLAVLVLLWFLFKSFSAVFWPVLVITFSAFWSIGFLSLIGVTLSTMVSLTFMLILAVGTADCVHVLSAYIYYRQHGHEHRPAMRKAYRKTGVPIFLTTITTMAGMLALMISDLPQIATFGLNSALGVGVAFILTIFVLPVLLDIWHPFHKKAEQKLEIKRHKTHQEKGESEAFHVNTLQRFLDKLPEWVGRRKITIIVCYFVFFGWFIYGTTLVKIDSNLIELTKEDSPIRITYELVDKNMMGGQTLEFMLEMNQRDAFKNADVLQTLEQFTQHLHKAYPDFVVKTFSLADFVKDTHKIMQGGDPSYESIPDDSILTAQLLYLFDNANADDRRDIVNDNYSSSHLTVQLKNKGSYEYTQFFEQVQADLQSHFGVLKPNYPDMQVSVTGSLALMMELVDHISWAQLKSFAFALLIITVLMMFSLGSVQAGLISMVPNLLPAFFTFGVMGLLDIPLDTDTLIIAPLIIGIAVDDTIHFIAHYRDAWFQTGDVDKALHSTLKEVGQAVTFTTLILGIGFSMLAFSDYMGLAKTGIFGSLSIVIALTSDLLLLPALIAWLKPDLGRTAFLEKQSRNVSTDTLQEKQEDNQDQPKLQQENSI